MSELTSALSKVLADTYLLSLKTQNFHWNVTGPNFYSLHKMFEEQYEALSEAIDEIAERIRTLGAPTPASFAEFLKLTSLEEAKSTLSASDMIKQLASDHLQIVQGSIKKCLSISQQQGDEATTDLMITRTDEHEKTAWMLKASQ